MEVKIKNMQTKLDEATYKAIMHRLIDVEMSWQEWCFEQVIKELEQAKKKKLPKD